MYWSNYHSHILFCDGRGSMEDFVKFAIAKRVRKYGFSSHAPLPFLTKWTMLEDDFADYEQEFERLKAKYENYIQLYLGLEVDYIHECSDVRAPFFKDKTFNYLIGSVHYLDKMANGEYWTIDGDFAGFDRGLKSLYGGDIRVATKRFFEISTLMIQLGGFNIVGHVDKIAMHSSNYHHFNISDDWYEKLMGEMFQSIKDKGMILEINTKSLHEKGITYPDSHFFPLINELNIPIIVSSDCHFPTNVIDGFAPTYRALKQAGFQTIYQQIAGRWEAVEFNEKGLFC
jgi:histidinol-phosphatase (PHP family)